MLIYNVGMRIFKNRLFQLNTFLLILVLLQFYFVAGGFIKNKVAFALPAQCLGTVSLSATAVSTGEIDLRWANGTDCLAFNIERSTDNASFAIIAYQYQPPAGTGWHYEDIGLSSGTTYYYRVKACNISNGICSPDYSNVASAKTFGSPPPPPPPGSSPAWKEPTAAFPGGNPAPPLDTGLISQSKSGSVHFNGVTIGDSVNGFPVPVVFDNSAVLYGLNSVGARELAFMPRYSDNSTALYFGTGGLNIMDTNGNTKISVNSTGVSILGSVSNQPNIFFQMTRVPTNAAIYYSPWSSANLDFGYISINSGGLRLASTVATRPACDSAHRGVIWFTNGGTSADHLSVCGYFTGGFTTSFKWKDVAN